LGMKEKEDIWGGKIGRMWGIGRHRTEPKPMSETNIYQNRNSLPPNNYKGGKNMTEENIIYIGKKPTMNYVLAVVTQLNRESNEVVIKARGKSISRAVDVAEIVKRKFVDGLTQNVTTDTEHLKNEEGKEVNVSAIEIKLTK